ncbi:hypothetical protein [Mesorhizobium sp. J8]|jgi:hypothetical protein|nr:hypothetical protein [Mesorhizobium sp. J8]
MNFLGAEAIDDLSLADSYSRKRALFLANMNRTGAFADALFLFKTIGRP